VRLLVSPKSANMVPIWLQHGYKLFALADKHLDWDRRAHREFRKKKLGKRLIVLYRCRLAGDVQARLKK